MRFVRNYVVLLFKNFSVVIICSLVFASCAKDDSIIQPSFTMEGKWEGEMVDDGSHTVSFFSIVVKNNGSLYRLHSNGSLLGIGRWQLSGDHFTGSYTLADNSLIYFSSVINTGSKNLIGTWSASSAYGGTLTAKEIPVRDR
jgi:triacylglycerol esterase/lipase EstA (alpha/beta hydrolase family)